MKSCRASHGPGQTPSLCVTFSGSERTQDHFQVGDKPGGQHLRVSFADTRGSGSISTDSSGFTYDSAVFKA